MICIFYGTEPLFEETREKGREKKDIFKDETDPRQGHGQFVIFILF